MKILGQLLALLPFLCLAQENTSVPESNAVPVPARPAPPVDPATVEIPVQEFRDRPGDGENVTRSKSMQFRISGSEPRLRGTIAFLAEDAKTDLLMLSNEKDEWKIPISLILHGQPGDTIPARTIVLDLYYGETGFQLIIHAHLAHGIETERLRSAVLSALIYERSLRTMKPGPLDENLIVRPWIVEGIHEVINWKNGDGDRKLYQSIFEAGGLYNLEEMLDVSQKKFDDYDGAMRAAFRVSAGGLMMALLEQPSGPEGFQAFLGEAAQFGGDMPVLLRKHFPSLSLSQKSLEKWWALQMANQSRNSLHEVMTIADTENALSQALKLRFRNEEGIAQDKDLTAWRELTALEAGARASGVRHAEEALVRLSYRCFPSYRPLLNEYQKILIALIQPQKNFDIAAKISELEEARLLMAQRGKRAVDYMDWFEITRARETTGVFDDYMKLKRRLDQGIKQNEDHVSRYLERIDKIYQR